MIAAGFEANKRHGRWLLVISACMLAAVFGQQVDEQLVLRKLDEPLPPPPVRLPSTVVTEAQSSIASPHTKTTAVKPTDAVTPATEKPALLDSKSASEPANKASVMDDANRPSVNEIVAPIARQILTTPKELAELMAQPVLDANQLLPERLDPFARSPSNPLAGIKERILGAGSQESNFSPAKQRQLLGNSIFLNSGHMPNDDQPIWHYQLQAGGQFRQGSTNSSNVNGLVQAERHTRDRDLFGKIGANYNQTENGIPNQRFFAEFLDDEHWRGRWMYFARDEMEYDEARRIKFRNVLSGGIAYRFIDELRARWIVRTGPTVTTISYFRPSDNLDGTYSGWLVESDFRRALTTLEGTRFEWVASAFPDFVDGNRFRIRNEAALIFPIGGVKSNWKWKISARQEYQYQRAVGTSSTDFEAIFSILYAK